MAVIVFAHPLAKSHYWDDFLSPIYGLSKKKALFVILQLEYFSSFCSELEKMDYSIPNLLKPNVQTFTKAKKIILSNDNFVLNFTTKILKYIDNRFEATHSKISK